MRSAVPDNEHLSAAERLYMWSRDELHMCRSVRMHEPIYRNPGELRRDVRALLALEQAWWQNFADQFGDEWADEARRTLPVHRSP